jgi:hypothetical protein
MSATCLTRVVVEVVEELVGRSDCVRRRAPAENVVATPVARLFAVSATLRYVDARLQCEDQDEGNLGRLPKEGWHGLGDFVAENGPPVEQDPQGQSSQRYGPNCGHQRRDDSEHIGAQDCRQLCAHPRKHDSFLYCTASNGRFAGGRANIETHLLPTSGNWHSSQSEPRFTTQSRAASESHRSKPGSFPVAPTVLCTRQAPIGLDHSPGAGMAVFGSAARPCSVNRALEASRPSYPKQSP